MLDNLHFPLFAPPPLSQFHFTCYNSEILPGTSGFSRKLISIKTFPASIAKSQAQVALAALSVVSPHKVLRGYLDIDSVSGLAMPFIANAVGRVLYSNYTPFKRWLLGCCTYLVVKGGVTLVRKYKLRRWTRARQVKDYEGSFVVLLLLFVTSVIIFPRNRRQRGRKSRRVFNRVEW